ncbi:MAG: tRNA 2-thiouridine(34) synthase MnmA [Cyanobacteria bacterium]|nr:tRNA 2-thiouridine(34) synthase MnmA [Cyanobacteriota bacterium]
MSFNTLPKTKKKIAVAMSGGVDSSVAAYLLAKEGHELVGITAWTLNGPGKCCNDALVNAGRVCEVLGFPYDTVDLRAEFSHYVMDYYHNTYEAGLTPNPCVECNRYVKWEQLVKFAQKEYGVDYVATGHYAKLHHTPEGSKVYRSRDEHKDQTYMMARVYPEDLTRTIFPLGDMTKPEVVALAKEVDLPTAYSKESQDICFVLDGQANYMEGVFGKRPGPIVDMDTGKVLGEHQGYYQYTVGQRKGVKVAAGRPIYVVKVDPKANTVYVGDKHHLETSTFRVLAVNWLEKPSQFPVEAMIKIRYNTPPTLGMIHQDPESATDQETYLVELHQPQMAITPGQIAAFYDSDFNQLWGGGYIEKYVSHLTYDPSTQKELPNLFCQTT